MLTILRWVHKDEEDDKPFCLICFKTLSASSMRNNTLEKNFNKMNLKLSEKGVDYFMNLCDNKRKNLEPTLTIAALGSAVWGWEGTIQ